MKAIKFFLLLLSHVSFSYGQNTGKIIPEKPRPQTGVTNVYIYQPPIHLAIPVKIYASLAYVIKEQYHFKRIPVNKVNGKYQFSFKAPDSTEVLIISINDDKNNLVDNNNELGFISYLYDKNGKITASARIAAMYLLSYYAIQPLKLNYAKLKPVMIWLFEEAYEMSPALRKEQPYYTYYLTILYQEKKDAVKNKLLAYAKQMSSSAHDETKWVNAIKIYELLEMNEEQRAVEQKAIAAYPNGKVAEGIFLNDFEKKDTTELSILASMKDYIQRFKDTSSQMKYTFYGNMIGRLLYNKQWSKLSIYESQMPSKMNLAGMYNNYARELSADEQFDGNGSDINIAKMLSKKSLDYVTELIKLAGNPDENDGNLQRAYNAYADTYALILYKLGKYDSAFYYQDAIYKQANNLNPADIERYVAYAEKAKGAKFAYQIIVNQLLNGISSPVMIDQLKTLAKKSGIPDSAYNSLSDKAAKLASEKSANKIKKLFGTLKSKNFILKNLKGQTVSLSSFKNKVVVLDFWATWCIPCRVSLSEMKETIKFYEHDKEVVFFFIDTWENNSAKQMFEAATKFMNEKGYAFEVLLDDKNKVANDYKVETIPARFIIDKKGNMVFMGDSSNLTVEIENAKN